jgi:hypothetical protein
VRSVRDRAPLLNTTRAAMRCTVPFARGSVTAKLRCPRRAITVRTRRPLTVTSMRRTGEPLTVTRKRPETQRLGLRRRAVTRRATAALTAAFGAAAEAGAGAATAGGTTRGVGFGWTMTTGAGSTALRNVHVIVSSGSTTIVAVDPEPVLSASSQAIASSFQPGVSASATV